MNKALEQLYIFKQNALQHLKAQRYLEASIYFNDILIKFNHVIASNTIDIDEILMEKIIKQINLSSHKNLTLCYLKLQKYRLCANQCKIVLEFEPNEVKFYYRIGMALINLDNLEEAEEHLKKAFLLNPQEKEIMKALEDIQNRKNTKIREEQQNKIKQKQRRSWKKKIIALLLIPLVIIKYILQVLEIWKQEKVLQKSK